MTFDKVLLEDVFYYGKEIYVKVSATEALGLDGKLHKFAANAVVSRDRPSKPYR